MRDIALTQELLQELLNQAAETGAKKALASIGLHDEKAAEDVKEMRSLLEALRIAKSTVWTTFWKLLTTAAVGAGLLWLGLKSYG